MSQTRLSRTIAAPVDRVFRTIADVREFSTAVPDIVEVELLSETRSGAGTRFRETRRFGKREAATELEVTEFEANQRIRIVSDAGGTVWDSLFTVRPAAGGTHLELVMDARPHALLARITTPLMRGVVRRAIERDMDAVKAYCEAGGGTEPGPQ
jgi:uncharacterized protein YndB with AHSA1/START domain